MKKYFTSLRDLESGLHSSIENVLETTVSDRIKGMISQSARSNVILQTAGRSSGGVDDVTQMVGSVKSKGNSIELTVKDVAVPSPSVFGQDFDASKNAAAGGTMFSKWIEHGQWIDLKAMLNYRSGIGWNPGSGEHWSDYYDPDAARTHDGMTKKEWNYKPRREPRPFITPVQEDLNAHPDIILNVIKNKL